MKPPPINCAHSKLVAIEKLRPNPRNPHQHPPEQIDVLAKLLTEHGWRSPITVSNRSGMIVRGHGRYLAAKKLGLLRVPVDRQDYASEALELADLLADNFSAQLAGLDRQAADRILADIADQLPDLPAAAAITPEELDAILASLPGSGEQLPEEALTLERPLSRMHILLSFPLDMAPEVLPLLKKVRELKGVEYESGQN